MKYQAQRIALAEWEGWTPHSVRDANSMWFSPGEKHRLLERTKWIPTYSSLDDMRPLRLKLKQDEKVKFLNILRLDILSRRLNLISDFDLLQSTVEEQREALLRAIGKWID